jgi:preprotein translocase subunit Sss1
MHNFGMIGLIALPTLLLIGIVGFVRNNKST